MDQEISCNAVDTVSFAFAFIACVPTPSCKAHSAPSHSIWILFLTNGLRLSILSSLTPFVTSEFQSHSLLTVIGIVANTMTAAVYIPMAKMLDIWGRAEGFMVMVACATLGVILMATSHNLATFCAARVEFPHLNITQYQKDGELTSTLGFLLCWICRNHLHRVRARRRCNQLEESRLGFCLHIFSVHDYSICWIESCRGVLQAC